MVRRKFKIGDIVKQRDRGSSSCTYIIANITNTNYSVYTPEQKKAGGIPYSYSLGSCENNCDLVETIEEKINRTLYTRQDTLTLKIPNSVIIIGVGGVGNHVAVDFALSGVNKIMVIDPDIIEISNLNRTIFKIIDVGLSKVGAVHDYILERRTCEVIPIQEKIEDVDLELFNDYELVVDCRDNSNKLPEQLQKKTRITGGYDGMNITIHINPSGNSVYGEETTTYSITPSWLVPPKLISLIIVTYIMASRPRTKEFIHSINIKNLIATLLSVKTDDIKEVIENVSI